MPKRVFITVAEVSGDHHAAQLIMSLKRLAPDLIIEGIGGPAMAAAGAKLHRETVGNAAMAWRGALRAVEVWQILRWTRNYFATYKPDLQICVDSFAMNIHFAKTAHAMKIPVLMYVAPQLWAWREGRMKKLRRNVDRVACILPFEETYFRSHQVNATFVGHPLFDELPPDRERPAPAPWRRGSDALHHTAMPDTMEGGGPPPPGLEGESPANSAKSTTPTASSIPSAQPGPVIGLLPGSRKSEAVANFSHMLDVAERILAQIPTARFLVPTTTATHPIVMAAVENWREAEPRRQIEFARGEFDTMVPRCDVCLTVSGTATLHVASFNVPMVVVYRVNPIIWNCAGKWLMKTRTFALVNLLAGGKPPHGRDDRAQHIVPEIVPWHGPNEPVARLLLDLLQDSGKRAAQQTNLRELIRTLDRPGASDNVARIALKMMLQASSPA
jgi:lipid-A-disaccharide synthase